MPRLPWSTRSIDDLKRALGFGRTFGATKFNYTVQYTSKVDFKNALVLAPHPGDEALGMGGTIKKMVTAGATVRVAFFTDGATDSEPSEIVKIKDEAKMACEILGVTETFFWGYRAGKLAAGQSASKALGDLIAQVKPDIIFLPSFLDSSADYRAANEVFINTASSLPAESLVFEVWAYEILTPIFINRMVDITLYIKTKEESIRAYASLLAKKRYDKGITALNQYRAEINGESGFGEGFFASNIELYKELYEKS
jgi:N-acetylglucosamine malate deacetylase 1